MEKVDNHWAIALRKTLLSLCLSSMGMGWNVQEPIWAQVVPDNTLGTERSVVTPNMIIRDGPADLIEGGAQRNSHLFHSFSTFSVEDGQRIYFANPIGVTNIFSRVTTANPSVIEGTVGVLGTANLFLINPSGTLFGPNAQLDIGGSLVVTSADGVRFGTQGNFRAIAPEAPPLLTVQPSALFFNQANPGTIENRSLAEAGISPNGSSFLFGLRVPDGQSLLLLGGDVILRGGQIEARGGHVELGGLVNPGEISLILDGEQLQSRLPETGHRGNIELLNGGNVNVRAGGGGTIKIYGHHINQESSVLRAGIDRDLGSPNARAGNIEINATGTIALQSGSAILHQILGNSAENFGQLGNIIIQAQDDILLDRSSVVNGLQNLVEGQGGNISISGRSLLLSNETLMQTISQGLGDAGHITINTQDVLSLDTSARISTTLDLPAIGNGGTIDIQTTTLEITNGSLLSSESFGQGEAGRIQIQADQVLLKGINAFGFPSSVLSSFGVFPDTQGRGGDIRVDSRELRLEDGGTLSASTFSQGNAGNIDLLVEDQTTLQGGRIFSSVVAFAEGNGGTVTLSTGSLNITDGGAIVTDTQGIGNAGKIIIAVPQGSVRIEGVGEGGFSSAISSAVITGAQGNSLGISLTAKDLVISKGGLLNARTSGDGLGGNVQVEVNTLSLLDGGQLLVNSASNRNAGNLTVTVGDTLHLSGQDPNFATRLAQFGPDVVDNSGPASGLFANATERSSGVGGNIQVTAQRIQVGEGATISVANRGSGSAGALALESRSLQLNQGEISGETVTGVGGDLNLKVQDSIVLQDQSVISTQANNDGDGGNITIDAQFIVADPLQNNDIIANAFAGNGGRIQLTTTGLFGLNVQDELTPFSDINASSELGVDGVVEINQPNSDPSQGLVNLQAVPLDATRQVMQACSSQQSNTGTGNLSRSQFIVIGRGGLPSRPKDVLTTDTEGLVPLGKPLYTDPIALYSPKRMSDTSRDTSSGPTPSAPLEEAQGWILSSSGQVLLIGRGHPLTPQSLAEGCREQTRGVNDGKIRTTTN